MKHPAREAPKRGCRCRRCEERRQYKAQWERDQTRMRPEYREARNARRRKDNVRTTA